MVATFTQTLSLRGYVDIHCHLIPGIDDGPADANESMAMADILASFGFTDIYCTPHIIRGAYDNHPEQIKEGAKLLQDLFARNNLPVTIHYSAEYYLDENLMKFLDNPVSLWDNVILLEAHRYIQPDILVDTASRIISEKRLRPLIAHPERCEFLDGVDKPMKRRFSLQKIFSRRTAYEYGSVRNDFALDAGRSSDVLDKLRGMGCLFQGNIGSFAGIYGEHVQRQALHYLRRGMYDHIGSDAHRPQGLSEWLQRGLEIIKMETMTNGTDSMVHLLKIPDSGRN